MKTALRLAIAAFALAIFNLSAATLCVSLERTNPTPPFESWATAATNIQQAVDAARPGDTMGVTNGVYRLGTVEVGGRNSGLSRVALTNAVIVRSVNGPEVTVIEGDTPVYDSETAPWLGHYVRCAYVGDGSVLNGFTRTKGQAWGGGGAFCRDSGVLTNCVLTGNSSAATSMLDATPGGGASECTPYNCTLAGNSATYAGGDQGTICSTAQYRCREEETLADQELQKATSLLQGDQDGMSN
jgi:hypothetical protein